MASIGVASVLAGATASGQVSTSNPPGPVTPRSSPGPAGRATLSGQVVDPDGKPATGVEIRVVDGYLPLGPKGVDRPAGQSIASAIQRSVRASGRTDSEGKFRMDVRGEPVAEERRVVLWAYRPGSLATTQELPRSALTSGKLLRVQLRPPAVAKYRVLGPDDQPVREARVIPTVLFRDSLDVPESLRDLVAEETDAEGIATISAFRPEEIAGFRVTASGFGTQQGSNRRSGRLDGTRTVTLLPVGSIKGRLITPDGKALADVRLLVATLPVTSPGPYVGSERVTTDRDGRFEVAVLPAGMLIMRVESPDTAESKHLQVNHLRINANEVLDLELKIEPGFLPAR
ncbi:MAG: carboxypeptidase-like regulatory domain-containing protein [Isosphaeraceae bacterium]